MNRYLVYLFSLTLFFPFSGHLLRAQEPDENASSESALRQDAQDNKTDAYIAYRVENGKLRNTYTPETTHRYDVYISSDYPLKTTSLSGRAGYTRYYRKGQPYSGMFRPASPLISFADTLTGNQKGEVYFLAGSAVHAFSPRWSAGLAGAYLAGNQAKDTDPRNKNSFNRISAAPCFQYRVRALEFGIKLYGEYERETISYRSFGSETKNGVTFYPLWFYTAESFADGQNSQRDYRRNLYQVDLSLLYKGKIGQTAFYPSYSRSRTRIWINPAKKQSAGEIAGKNFRLENKTNISAFRYTHRFVPGFTFSRNKIYDVQQQLSADYRIYETILKIKRAEVTDISAALHYTLSPKFHPDRAIKAILEYKTRNSLFRLPPSDFKQEVTRLKFSASYARSFILFGHLLNGDVQAGYSTGYGAQPNLSLLGGQTVFRSQNHSLEREFQYLTASILGVAVKLRYTFPLNRSKSDFYLEAHNRFRTTCPSSGWSARANHFKFSAGILF